MSLGTAGLGGAGLALEGVGLGSAGLEGGVAAAVAGGVGPDLLDLTATAHSYITFDYQGISWNDDGTKLFLTHDTGGSNGEVQSWTVSPAYSLVEANRSELTGETFLPLNMNQPNEHFWKPDGTMIFVVASGADRIFWATCSVAFDLSTIGTISDSDISADGTIPVGLTFNDDGSEMFISYNATSVKKYVLGTVYDPSTRGAASVVLDLTANQTAGGQGIDFASDGLKFYSVDITDEQIDQYNLTVAYDLSTAVFQSAQATTLEAACHGCWVRDDDSRIYVSHNNVNRKLTVLA